MITTNTRATKWITCPTRCNRVRGAMLESRIRTNVVGPTVETGETVIDNTRPQFVEGTAVAGDDTAPPLARVTDTALDDTRSSSGEGVVATAVDVQVPSAVLIDGALETSRSAFYSDVARCTLTVMVGIALFFTVRVLAAFFSNP